MAHHDDPSQTFVEQIAERGIIADGLDRVIQQHHFVALLGDEPGPPVNRRPGGFRVPDTRQTTQVRACRGDRRTQRKLDSFELPVTRTPA